MTEAIDTQAVLAQLGARARAASANAHAPYSGFLVGAALAVDDGTVFTACNVESASYGLTQCAERNALGSAVAAGTRPGQVNRLVIYLPGDTPLPPCGACRQVMAEFMPPDAVVVSCCDSDATLSWTVRQLLPQPFLGR